MYAPFTKKQAKVLTFWHKGNKSSNYSGIIADGSIRSGKTLSLSLSFCMWAMSNYNRQCFALCGKTLGSFRRNVLHLLKHMLRGRGYTVRELRSENLLIVCNGNTVNKFYVFGGKDEGSADLIQGITLAGVLFDEVALMPESFVNQATARCSIPGSKWWFSCNPEGPYHWFYTEWILKKQQKNLLYVHFTMDDNPSLTKQVKQRYENMYSGVFYERYVRGLWVVAEGLVYPMAAGNSSIILHNDTSILSGIFYISIDYGTRNPFSMGLWCVSAGKAVRIKEWYYDSKKQPSQLTDEQYYEQLELFASGFVIRNVIIDPSAASFIQTVRKHAHFSVKKAVNSVLDGIRITASLLEGGRVKISPNCVNILKEFNLYRWSDTLGGKDEVLKQDDHAMDEMRYFCATVLAREFKWIDWR